jgi:hypothetical protein
MSTTTDKETAFAYSGVTNQRGTVFEITAGRVDVGASISFLSQYPGEAEFLMPPLSCLEARPRLHPNAQLGNATNPLPPSCILSSRPPTLRSHSPLVW